MKSKIALGIAFFLLCAAFVISGCTNKSNSPTEAIQYAQTLKTVTEKSDYLVKQAQAFMNSKQYQQAIDTAQYILSNLDKNYQPAKDLIEQAKAGLQAAAQKAVGDTTNRLLGK